LLQVVGRWRWWSSLLLVAAAVGLAAVVREGRSVVEASGCCFVAVACVRWSRLEMGGAAGSVGVLLEIWFGLWWLRVGWERRACRGLNQGLHDLVADHGGREMLGE
jgi:hypothetical protein